MTEPLEESFTASDAYSIHVTRWPTAIARRAAVVVVHGVQSHGGWYHNLGRTLAERGYEAIFPDRRGSGKNHRDRGHARSDRRLLDDLAEQIRAFRNEIPSTPVALAGISWGGKLAVALAAREPGLVDALALICPGLHPRVDVGRGERIRITLAYLTNRRKQFPIPLADPALFTDQAAGQAFIAGDPLSLRTASASLLAASRFLDAKVRAARPLVRQPTLLMLAGRDRIVDNRATLDYFQGMDEAEKTLIEYPEGHHTLEFEEDPSTYANDLATWFDTVLHPKE